MTTSQTVIPPEVDELPQFEREGEGGGMHPAWILVLLVAVGGIVYMLFDGTKSETYFMEVDQAVTRQDELVGEVIRIKGEVEKGSIVSQKGQLQTTFRVAAKGKSVEVTYDKAMPDTFDAGQEVVVQGKLEQGLKINADEVVVKCPSRYEGQPPTAQDAAAHEAATGKKLPAQYLKKIETKPQP